MGDIDGGRFLREPVPPVVSSRPAATPVVSSKPPEALTQELPFTEAQYEHWRERWQKQHPERNPPTMREFNMLMVMFCLRPCDIGVPDASELDKLTVCRP